MDDPKKAEAIGIAATGKLKDLKYKDALNLFNQARKKSFEFCGNKPFFFSRRGECYLNLGFDKEALEDIRKACEISQQAYFKFQLCSAYFSSGQYAVALENINCFLPELKNDEAYLRGGYFLLQAAIYHKLGDLDQVYAFLEKAAEHNIDDINVLQYEELYDDVSEDERFISLFDA